MFVISIKKKVKSKGDSSDYAYLCRNSDGLLKFSDFSTALKFGSVDAARVFFFSNKRYLAKTVNRDVYDVSTLGTRKVLFKTEENLILDYMKECKI